MNRADHYREAGRLAEVAVEVLVAERTRLAKSPTTAPQNAPALRLADLFLRAAAVHEGLANAPDKVERAAADIEARKSDVARVLATDPPRPAVVRPSPRLHTVTGRTTR